MSDIVSKAHLQFVGFKLTMIHFTMSRLLFDLLMNPYIPKPLFTILKNSYIGYVSKSLKASVQY